MCGSRLPWSALRRLTRFSSDLQAPLRSPSPERTLTHSGSVSAAGCPENRSFIAPISAEDPREITSNSELPSMRDGRSFGKAISTTSGLRLLTFCGTEGFQFAAGQNGALVFHPPDAAAETTPPHCLMPARFQVYGTHGVAAASPRHGLCQIRSSAGPIRVLKLMGWRRFTAK